MPKSLKINKVSKNNYSYAYIDSDIPDNYGAGNVVIESKFASLNYKDFLVANGDPGLVRRYPHTPGIDIAGVVINSKHPSFKEGDIVYSIGTSLGISCNGSFAQLVVLPGEWLIHASSMDQLKKSMMIGTSGVTASFILDLIESVQCKKGLDKSILISAPRSSVSSFLLRSLDSLNYTISLISRNNDSSDNGYSCFQASKFTSIDDIDSTKSFSLRKPCFSFAIDMVGGNATQYMLSSLNPGGVLFSLGGLIDSSANISLLPFFLRGVQAIGVNTESRPQEDVRAAVLKLMSSPQVMNEKCWKILDFFALGSVLTTNDGYVKTHPHTLIEFK